MAYTCEATTLLFVRKTRDLGQVFEDDQVDKKENTFTDNTSNSHIATFVRSMQCQIFILSTLHWTAYCYSYSCMHASLGGRRGGRGSEKSSWALYLGAKLGPAVPCSRTHAAILFGGRIGLLTCLHRCQRQGKTRI